MTRAFEELPGDAFFCSGGSMFKKNNGLSARAQTASPADSSSQDLTGSPRVKALSCFGPGRKVVIVGHSGGRQLWGKMESLGLMPGTEVTVVVNSGSGPLLVAVENSRFMLGRGMSSAILAMEPSPA